jgi:ribonuclease Z
MEVIFLGTSSMVPTKERNHSSLLLNFKSEGILIDCGEGTQRQLKICGIKPSRITKILISHWHGDHVLGLPGLLQTMASGDYTGKLRIYGPKGTKEHFRHMEAAFVFEDALDYEVSEVESGIFVDDKEYCLEALPVEHGMRCLAYAFIEKDRRRIKPDVLKKLGIPDGPHLASLQEGKPLVWKNRTITPEEATYIVKGKRISFIADTLFCDNCLKIAKDSDLLICEATYANDLREKAEQYKHMTAEQAAQVANMAKVKRLVLTHFSQRYKNCQQIEEDARAVFNNITCANDFMKIVL